MEHLSAEVLAKLVDQPPEPNEAEHLNGCAACAAELQAMRLQTEQLGSLPALLPPLGDWDVLEARLRSEGLVSDPGFFRHMGLAHTPAWMRAAAAAVLFLAGAGAGAGFASLGSGPAGSGRVAGPALAANATIEDAAAAVQVAEQSYVDALAQYRQLLGDGQGAGVADQAGRMAALEYLFAATQAAVRQAPADQFLNGLLAATRAEREATLRQVSTRRGNWF